MEAINKLFDNFASYFGNNSSDNFNQEINTNADFVEENPRLLIYRTCTYRGRKILFDSLNVTDEGLYLPQTDHKFLKEVIGEFVFGNVSVSQDTFRFSKITHGNEVYSCWGFVYFHSSYSNSYVNVSEEDRCSQGDSSSSGYSSLPNMQLPKNATTNLKTTCSLPSTKICKTTQLAICLLTSQSTKINLQNEMLKIRNLVEKFYVKSNFACVLKSYANCLKSDLNNKLVKKTLRNKYNWSLKVIPELLKFLVANSDANIVIVTKNLNNAECLFNLVELVRGSYHSYKLNNVDVVDSGFFSCHGDSDFDETDCDTETKAGFYLGNNCEDEQTEERLGLGEVNKDLLLLGNNKGKSNLNFVNPLSVELDLDVTMVKDNLKYYYINKYKFSPFVDYQVFNNNCCEFDYVHSLTCKVIEVNLDKSFVKGINCDKSKFDFFELVDKTRELSGLISDIDKVSGFFCVHFCEVLNKGS